MEDPVADIPTVVSLLTQSIPSVQRSTIERHFTPDASFNHPLCRTGGFSGSRWLISMVYRWYKIMSPAIDIAVESVAFDERNLILYMTVHQTFSPWLVPFWNAKVSLVVVLHLIKTPSAAAGDRPRYLIRRQDDLYQTNELAKFGSFFGVLPSVVMLIQFVVTVACALGAIVFWPISWLEEQLILDNRSAPWHRQQSTSIKS